MCCYWRPGLPCLCFSTILPYGRCLGWVHWTSKICNKSTFKNTHTYYASADFLTIAGLYQTSCILCVIWAEKRKKNTSKWGTCFMSFITCIHSQSDYKSIVHKTSSMVNVYGQHITVSCIAGQGVKNKKIASTHSIY